VKVCNALSASPVSTEQVHSEAELKRILPIAKKHGVPVTFRAAGTSLSGQAITDSVLLKISHTGKHFRNFTIHVSMSLRLMQSFEEEPAE